MAESNDLVDFDEATQQLKQDIVRGVTEFTTSMNKLLYKQDRQAGNVLFSPINIYSALALVHMATDGKSQEEIAQVTKLPKDKNRIQQAHKIVGETLKAVTDTTETDVYDENGWHKAKTTIIKIANGIFVQENFNILQSYVSQAQLHYQSAVCNVDFNNDPDKSTDIINEFVSENTNQRIPRIFDNPVPSETRVVLTSCLYFKANWEEDFPEYGTADGDFDSGSGNITVKMMTNREYVPYIDSATLQLEAISLGYKGGDVSMFFILPYSNQPLENLVSTLTGDKLRQVINGTKSTYVDYKVPRMKFKWSEDINGKLVQMGVNEIFTDHANLNNMLVEDKLKVSQIVHAAEIEIDEKGTEASAATAVKMMLCCAVRHPEPKQFHLNRPFLLFVHHHQTETILFIAAVHNPIGA